MSEGEYHSVGVGSPHPVQERFSNGRVRVVEFDLQRSRYRWINAGLSQNENCYIGQGILAPTEIGQIRHQLAMEC